VYFINCGKVVCHRVSYFVYYLIVVWLSVAWKGLSLKLGTCKASIFDLNSNRTIPIRFESDRLIQEFRIVNFESARLHLPSHHKPRSLFNKNFNRCAVVIEIYFMFMILCLYIHTFIVCGSHKLDNNRHTN